MSFSPDAADAALLAWANACLQSHSEDAAPTLEAIVDTNSLSIMCKKFHLGDPEQGARKQSAAQRRRQVAEVLNSCRIGLVEPSMAELGGPAAARSITAAILLIAVEAPAKEEAIQVIVTLDQAQQAELAQIIQQLMETTGLDPPPEPVEKVPQGPPGSCRSSMSSARRRFSDVQLAGNDPTEIEPLQAEARELLQELEQYTNGFMEKKKVHSSIASKVADAKAQLCSEADRCVDLIQELNAKDSEHRSLSRDLINLKEELKHEGSAATSNSEALKELGSELEEERRRYRTLAMRHIDLKAEVDQAQHSSAQVEASSWKRTAMMAKLHRLQDRVHCDRGRLAESQRIFWAEEACSSSLREELEQAQEVLSQRQTTLSACEESVSNSEGVLQLAESELDSCTQELKAMSSEDVDSLQVEIEKKKQAFARAEQGTADAISQRATIGKQISEVSASLEDNRTAAERATTEAVAEGVAAKKALQQLHVLNEAAPVVQGDRSPMVESQQESRAVAQTEASSSGLREELGQAQEVLSQRQAALSAREESVANSEEMFSQRQAAVSACEKSMVKLQEELKQAQEVLSHRQVALSACEESAANSEGVLQLAESELNTYTLELKAMCSEEVEGVPVEIEKEHQALAKAEQSATAAATAATIPESAQADSVAQQHTGAELEDTQIAERTTSEAAKDVAASNALELLDAPNDEATAMDEGAGLETNTEITEAKADFSAMVKRSRPPSGRAAKDAAATKLQSRQRGIMARSKMATLRATRASGASEAPKDVSYQRIKQPLAPAKREERERAAIKLQALERGVLARSRVQRLKDARAMTLAPQEEKKASKKLQSISELRGSLSAKAPHRQTQQGPSVNLLEEQIQLRQQELAFKENQASEAEAAHSREVALMASSLHRLGMRYGRLLGQCQALEALVPERVRRMREGNPTN